MLVMCPIINLLLVGLYKYYISSTHYGHIPTKGRFEVVTNSEETKIFQTWKIWLILAITNKCKSEMQGFCLPFLEAIDVIGHPIFEHIKLMQSCNIVRLQSSSFGKLFKLILPSGRIK